MSKGIKSSNLLLTAIIPKSLISKNFKFNSDLLQNVLNRAGTKGWHG
ncbi:hypothetical protein [Marinomonas sp. FW-1]|nr:hypothetical protein [Marinomonas sp. FW-1]